MVAKVNLHDVVHEIEVQGDATVYMDTNTAEFVFVDDELKSALDRDVEDVPEWERNMLPKVKEALESDHFVPLPSRYELREWQLMREFSDRQPDPKVSRRLEDALHRKGAYRHFRIELRKRGLEQAWYRYRDEALERLAIQWLEENGIRYER